MPRNKPEKGKAIPSAAGSYVSSDPGKLRYGRFLEAADLLCKYIKPKDNILVTGSGNSDLGAEMYFAGLKNITIIDDSQVLVDRMAKRYKSDCPDMKFVKDDLMQMGTVDDQSFTVVLDKATFDAVVADGSAKSSEIARKTCLEVDRVLKWSGRYICISLAQKHALTPLVMNMAERNYAVRGHVLNIVNEHFGSLPDAVFCFVFTKMKPGGPLVCDLQLHPTEKIIRLHDLHQFFRQIREYQYAQTLRGCLKMGRYDDVEGEHLKIFSGDKSAHQYNLYPYKSDVKRPQFAAACFIIPPGRSKTYLYGTHEGRKEVAEKSIRAQLVMFVEVVRSFGGVFNFDIVKEELTPHLKNLTPSKLFENMVFITDGAFPESEKFVPGDDVIFEGESPTTGGYRVIQRRLPGENDYERRLIFTANPSVIQTEMRIKKGWGKL